ncbi:MAG: LysR family transcriptional regulator [Marinobacterium sp.]|nr:LysR family transcriptional regulator [Marinobacterium sp.]
MKKQLNRTWLQTFLVLARQRHFTRTAQQLCMTQPGVSQHLQKLEQQLGQPLITRAGRQLELTPAGEKLWQWGMAQQEEEQRLLASLADDDPFSGEVRIACSGAQALSLYPRFLDHLACHSGLQLQLEAAPNSRILAQLQNGETELGLVSQHNIPEPLVAQPAGAQPLCLVVPADWSGCATSLAELNRLGFIDHPDGAHYATQVLGQMLNGFAGYHNLYRRGYINQIDQILLPVSRGLGYTVVPERVVEASWLKAGVRILSSEQPVLEPLYLLRRRHRQLPARYHWFQQQLVSIADGSDGAGCSDKTDSSSNR